MLKGIRAEYAIDVCVANGENCSGGRGITKNLITKLRRFGVNVVTSGNHIWDNKDGVEAFATEPFLLRPLNYPAGNPGCGSCMYTLEDGRTIGVINLQGRVFMYPIECPLKTGLVEINKLRERTDIVLVDFHAEATSEKLAAAWYFNGKITALMGTHTHVQTADERILDQGTAYITDAGMTGAHDSVIGMKREGVIRKFLYETPVRFEPSEDGLMFNGVVVTADDATGKATAIQRIIRKFETSGGTTNGEPD
ncbi:MAG: hypothetical protein A2350_04465 [Candidatus Raymondbacteria bacterium RifOxyB12_full_50_8]|nr:MAG: hypothetical protein A2350_04465 [Candidatus Raymondbacteria bacterium RifOxyB12_full_50_8]